MATEAGQRGLVQAQRKQRVWPARVVDEAEDWWVRVARVFEPWRAVWTWEFWAAPVEVPEVFAAYSVRLSELAELVGS